jgi:tripartite-type tricarboxylate transporter receptor subunit TctC
MTHLNTTTRRSFTALAASLLAAAALPASAQTGSDWPTRPLRIIVGYPAGSSPDMQARLLLDPLAKALGQPVIVENKPGASGNIGADALAKADDGHTIGVIGNGPLTSSKFLYAKLPYDTAKDFAPIALIGSAPLVWVATNSSAAQTPAEYIKATQAAGSKLAYGSIGSGSGGHLAMELIKDTLKIDPLHVPFSGGPAILNAMLGGQVQMTLLPNSTVAPMVQAGKLRAIAVSSAARSPLAPELPSMLELGAPGINIEVWNAVMAPAKMPAAHQAKLNAALGKILNTPDVKQKLFVQGWKVEDTSQATLAQRIQADTKLYGDLIRKKDIKLE